LPAAARVVVLASGPVLWQWAAKADMVVLFVSGPLRSADVGRPWYADLWFDLREWAVSW
jgi:hypothetical protein